MYKAVYIEINLICSIIPLLILHRLSASNDRQAARLVYRRMLVATLAILLIDVAWTLIEGRTQPAFVFLNHLLNMAYLFDTGLISYLWLQFVLCRLRKNARRHTGYRILQLLPLAILLIFCLLNPWTKWLFEISEMNIYRREPLIIIMQLICYGYLLAGSGFALIYALREKDAEKRSDALTLSSFALLPAAGSVIAVLVYGLPILWPLTAFSELMVYLNLQSRQISTDELTGLNNRRQFDRYLAAQIEDPHREERLYLLLIDVDNFKKINDSLGHLTGDEALIQASGVLKQVCGVWSCFLARYGGDEFAIVFRAHDAGRVERLRQDLHDAFERFNASSSAPYTLRISIGTGTYAQETNSASKLIAQADQALYQMKAEKKMLR